jgi:hypothetical protein
MASEDLKRIVATQVASGFSIADLARQHDYSYNGMHQLVHTKEIQEKVQKHRAYLQDVWSRIYFRVAQHGEALAAGMLSEAFDDNSAKQFEARKYCLEQLKPASQNHTGSLDINVKLAQQVFVDFSDALGKAIQVREAAGITIHSSPHLLDGRDSIPEELLVQEDGGPPPTPTHIRTNRNGDLTHPSTPRDLAGNEAAQEFNHQRPPEDAE